MSRTDHERVDRQTTKRRTPSRCLPSSLLGVLQKCVDTMSPNGWSSLGDSEECASSLFGNHPLGNMIRDIVIHPGKTAECFRDLAEQIPTCSMDLWPFPVSGEIVRMGACIAAMIEDMVLGQCTDILDTLYRQCLPNYPIASSDCDDIISLQELF